MASRPLNCTFEHPPDAEIWPAGEWKEKETPFDLLRELFDISERTEGKTLLG